jgi:hypothetical protein
MVLNFPFRCLYGCGYKMKRPATPVQKDGARSVVFEVEFVRAQVDEGQDHQRWLAVLLKLIEAGEKKEGK